MARYASIPLHSKLAAGQPGTGDWYKTMNMLWATANCQREMPEFESALILRPAVKRPVRN